MKKIILLMIVFSFYSSVFASNKIYVEKSNQIIDVKIDILKSENKIINKELIKYVKQVWKEFLFDTNNLEVLSEKSKYEFIVTWESKIIWNISTYKLTIYQFTGWAHWTTIIKTFNFDKKWNNINLLNKNFLKKISEYSIKYFKEKVKKWEFDSNNELIEQWLQANNENFKNYIITDIKDKNMNIKFIFDQYQIWAYYLWNPFIEIETNNLK